MRYPNNWHPPHKIIWYGLWYLPAQTARVLLCAIMFCGWGREACRDMWNATF